MVTFPFFLTYIYIYIYIYKIHNGEEEICLDFTFPYHQDIFVPPCIEHFLRLLSPLSGFFFFWLDISIYFDFFPTIKVFSLFLFYEIFSQISICVLAYS